jgi:hypothetical protein
MIIRGGQLREHSELRRAHLANVTYGSVDDNAETPCDVFDVCRAQVMLVLIQARPYKPQVLGTPRRTRRQKAVEVGRTWNASSRGAHLRRWDEIWTRSFRPIFEGMGPSSKV